MFSTDHPGIDTACILINLAFGVLMLNNRTRAALMPKWAQHKMKPEERRGPWS